MDSQNYSVTIMNQSGADCMHTWLIFEPEKHFSFDSPSFQSAVTCNRDGKIESAEESARRKHDECKKFPISKEQFEKMMKKISELSAGATYALIPLRKSEYNCVVASREVLKAGGIDFLNDVITPFGVSGKILGDPSYKDSDAQVIPYALVPRASAAAVRAVGLSLDDGPTGWILGSALAAGAAYLIFKVGQRN